MTQITLRTAWQIPQPAAAIITPSATSATLHTAPQSRLNLIHINAQSLSQTKAALLSQLALQHQAQILCVSELGHRRSIPRFTCVISTDTHTQSGIFVRSGIKASPFDDPLLHLPPSRIAGEGITIDGTIILHVYIPPQTSISHRRTYWRQLTDLAHQHADSPIIVCGDLNTHSTLFQPDATSRAHRYLEELVEELPWYVQNDGSATRLHAALDACLTNTSAASLVTQWETLDEAISDHRACLLTTSLPVTDPHGDKSLTPTTVIDLRCTLTAAETRIRNRLNTGGGPIPIDEAWDLVSQSITTKTIFSKIKDFWN